MVFCVWQGEGGSNIGNISTDDNKARRKITRKDVPVFKFAGYDNTRRLSRGALFLALALAVQSLRLILPLPPFLTVFIIGVLLNAIMFIAQRTAGGALAIAVFTPVVAFLQGQLPLLPLIPLVAAGNLTYITVIRFFTSPFGIVAAAAAKTLVLYAGLRAVLTMFALPPALAGAITFALGWPQFITALSGGAVGALLLARLKNTADGE